MSKYSPKEGDRVFIVLEGDVTRKMLNGSFYVGGYHWIDVNDPDGTVVSIEKLARPLPTTPNSFVRAHHPHCDGTYFHLTMDGAWHCTHPKHGSAVRPDLFEDVEVIFDAGAK